MPNRYGDDRDEFDDRPRVGPNGCKAGGQCDGHGWVTVTEHYAERLFPLPDPPALGSTDEDLANYDANVATVLARRAGAHDAVYPCRACRTDQFFRWVDGHYDRNHDSDRCPACIEARTRKRATA